MKKSLLISFVAAMFLISGCDSKQQEQTQKKIEEVKKAVNEKVEQTSQKAQELAQEAEEKSEEISKSLNESVQQTKETIVDESEVPIEQTKEAAKEAAKKIKESVEPEQAGKSGQELYVACIACHGAKAEKKALNASAVIANWSQEEIYNALKGYKDGTYGGNMKGTMTGQVARLSDEEIQRLAEYITTL